MATPFIVKFSNKVVKTYKAVSTPSEHNPQVIKFEAQIIKLYVKSKTETLVLRNNTSITNKEYK